MGLNGTNEALCAVWYVYAKVSCAGEHADRRVRASRTVFLSLATGVDVLGSAGWIDRCPQVCMSVGSSRSVFEDDDYIQ